MADPVSPIKMVGAPGSLPPELQARAAQVALQQQVAQAMLAQSMGVESPVIQGPSGNPFARSVVNLAPLGKMAESYMGYNKAAGAADDLQQIAAAGEQIRLAGIQGARAPITEPGVGPPNPETGEAPPSTQRAPTPYEIAFSLIASPHPANQQLGQAWLEKQMDLEGKGMATPEVIAAATRAGIDPASIPGAMGTGALTGVPTITHPEKLKMLGETKTVGPTETPVVVNRQDKTVTVPPTVGAPGTAPGAPPPAAGGAGGPAAAPTPPAFGRSPESVEAGKTAAKSTVDYWLDPKEGQLPTIYAEARNFQNQVPVIAEMAKLTENAPMGFQGDNLTKARQLAVRLGLSDDKANQITDLQTLMKLAMVPAIAQARTLTTRPSQMEFLKTLEANAADPNIDPRTAQNVIKGFMTYGLNTLNEHSNLMAKAAQAGPEVASRLSSFTIPGSGGAVKPIPTEGFDGKQLSPDMPVGSTSAPEERALAQFMNIYGGSTNFQKDSSGAWYTPDILTHKTSIPPRAGTPTAAPPATSPDVQKLLDKYKKK